MDLDHIKRLLATIDGAPALTERAMRRRAWRDERLNEMLDYKPRTPRSKRPRCGATTRKGTPCQARAVWDLDRDRPVNGRCRCHGGLSTGPRTDAGRTAIQESNRRRAVLRDLAALCPHRLSARLRRRLSDDLLAMARGERLARRSPAHRTTWWRQALDRIRAREAQRTAPKKCVR